MFRAEVASAAQQALQVFITNGAANPVPVQQQGIVRTDRGQALQTVTFIESFITGPHFVELYTVPAGKQLEIEYVDVTVTYPIGDDKPYLSLYTTVGGVTSSWTQQIPSAGRGTGTHATYSGEHLVRIYADPGTLVRLWVNPDGTSVGGGINLSGRLFDVP